MSSFEPNVILGSTESDGVLAMVEHTAPAGWPGHPLHRHDRDEGYHVLDGELTFQVGQELVRRRGGELAFVKRGVHHAFANLSGADARMLLVCTPAGFERYFQRMAAEDAGVEPPPEALEPWPEVIKVGPPIAAVQV